NRLLFSRRQYPGLGKSAQSTELFFNLSDWKGHIKLNHFFSGKLLAVVSHFDRNSYLSVFCRFNAGSIHGERCIGHSIPESVTYRNLEGIKITVSHIDAFLVLLLLNISVVMRKCCGIRIVIIRKCPCISQFSTWRNNPADNICHGSAALLARL